MSWEDRARTGYIGKSKDHRGHLFFVTRIVTMKLVPYRHQEQALATTIENGFESGTHAHATGSGKSLIGHLIVREFGRRFPGQLMIWLCEQVDVVAQTFAKASAREGLLICDLVNKKPRDWWHGVQSALCWNKPVLMIVNRAFLVSRKRYENMSCPIGLVVHDECHTAAGDTTKEFYRWAKEANPRMKVIGLSATPPAEDEGACPELSNVLTRFSIYDAAMSGVIVPLRMAWCDSAKQNLSIMDMAEITLAMAEKHAIRKIIVWCGTIDFCFSAAEEWSELFDGFLISVDTSRKSEQWASFQEFMACDKGVLFCAAKHKEGSDIPGLGMGVFIDGVEERGSTVFVQCAGRVLRRSTDGSHKPYGLLLDLKARDGLELCDRVGEFLQLPAGSMPWTQASDVVAGTIVNSLTLTYVPPDSVIGARAADEPVPDLRTLFVRLCPDTDVYRDRLEREMKLMEEHKMTDQLTRAIEVLRLAGDDVPHVTRGSCGSSLVCYLLGISHVDPVLHGICFSRFLNEFRSSLPDIDFDFPHNQRADIFLRMAIRWPGTVARISNHVHFHEKSALREALRRNGLKGNVAALEMTKYVNSLPRRKREAVKRDAKKLEGDFNCYSLHCGGVVYYPNGIPKEDLLPGKQGNLLAQVKLDKRDVAGVGHFKIDILSSRALSQLVYAMKLAGCPDLDLSNPPFTEAMVTALATGDNIGVTLAESPLCRDEFKRRKPKSVNDISECLARIRPAARQSKVDIVYDDDAIHIIQKALQCTEAEADAFRRGLAKRDTAAMNAVKRRLGARRCKKLADDLGSLSLYGFCKAHAMSYAQLVTWLVWCKTEYPIEFWAGALDSCQSSYRPWVHMWEAHKAGLDALSTDYGRNSGSIYSEARRRRFIDLDVWSQLRTHWYWDVRRGFIPDCFCKEIPVRAGGTKIKLRGVVASHRKLSDTSLAITIGTGDRYVDTIANFRGFHGGVRIAEGWVAPDGKATLRYS